MCNSKSFSTLGLREELLSSTADLGYAEMTTVQSRCLPGIVAGEDVLLQETEESADGDERRLQVV